MSDFLPVVREILRECLSVAPMKGARLKPLVMVEFERRTRTSFAQAFWNFPKFSDLLKVVEDLVEIDRSGPADILIRLRSHEASSTSSSASVSNLSSQPYIHPGLWHAFNNPDGRRRRFYHRKTGEVVHYVEGSQVDADFVARVAADPDFVEIKPIPVAEHSAWMKEFATTQMLPETTRAAAISLASVPYTSQLNRAFTAALEGYAEGWRRFRTSKVLARVQKWAKENNIAIPELIRTPVERAIDAASNVSAATTGAALGLTHDTRKLLHALVDSLDETDLAHVLVPASALVRIAGARS